MPRKSHRRRRKKTGQAIRLPTRAEIALEEQDRLRQERLRRHLDRALQGRRRPPEEFIIERLKQKNETRNCNDDRRKD